MVIFFTIFRLLNLNSIILHKVVKKYRNRKNTTKNLRGLLVILFFILSPTLAFSQTQKKESNGVNALELSNKNDSLKLRTDSIQVKADTAKLKEGAIKTTVNYKAKDSINFNLKTQDIVMYKTSHVDYGDIELDADKIKVNYATKILDAEGLKDSTGKEMGKPIFTDKGQVYQTEAITYNFDTRKAIIKGVVTQQGEAYLHSEWVKKNEKDEIFGHDNMYTTCNLAHPHFGIAASQIKMIPNDKILAGPFNLEINEIPTPFLFPFGMFPMPNKKTSGILFPTYGEEKLRGFFLKNGGYYWAVNEYVDLALTGDIYSKGSFGLSAATKYKKRYSYNGNFTLRFSQQKGINSNIAAEVDSSVSRDFWVNWSHRPESKGTGRFTASVQGGSNSYNNNNPTGNLQQNTTQRFNSNVSYSNVIPNSPFNYVISARHEQNVTTKEVSLLLPEMALNMNRQMPFKNVKADYLTWLSKLNYSYNFSTRNEISNNIGRIGDSDKDSIAEFSFDNMPLFLKNAKNGAKHRIPVQTSFNIFNYITVAPVFNYEEIWYLKELDHKWDDVNNELVIDTLNGFSRAAAYNASVNFNTRLYGMIYPNIGPLKAMRHVATPSLGFSWRPDFADPKYGIYKEVQVDTLGNTREFSKFQGFGYGSPGSGKSAVISFGLVNVLEMKVRQKNDTAETDKKVSVFENLSISSGYNILADSFNLSDFNLSARTTLFNKKLNITVNANLNPYLIRLDSITNEGTSTERVYQTELNQYAWNAGKGLGRLTSVGIVLRTNLNPKGRESDNNTRNDLEDKARAAGLQEDQVQEIANNPDLYVNFDVPWNLNVTYNLNWSKQGFEEATIRQTLGFRGDVNFTENWKVGFTSGYDFENKSFVNATSFSIYRNLHCWQINATWVPFGRGEFFSVDIGVKASILQDLKLNRRKNWTDNF